MGFKISQSGRAKKIKIPSICEELAEDIGIQIGDGCIGIYGGKCVITVVGNLKEDKKYLLNFVKPLKEQLYNVKVAKNPNKNAGTFVLRIYSKNLLRFYKKIGLPIGPKCNVKTPGFIFKNKEFQIAFLRGLADTDGSLSFRKGRCKKHIKPIIKFAMKSKKLAEDVCRILDNLEFSYTLFHYTNKFDKRTKKFYPIFEISIQGKKNLEKWMGLIGFHNLVQTTRYMVYKKLGYCPPRTTLIERLKILSGGTGVS